MARHDRLLANSSSIQSRARGSNPALPPPAGPPAASSASELSRLIADHLQMPLQSTGCVGHTIFHALSVLRELNHRPHPEKPSKTLDSFSSVAILNSPSLCFMFFQRHTSHYHHLPASTTVGHCSIFFSDESTSNIAGLPSVTRFNVPPPITYLSFDSAPSRSCSART